MAKNRKARRIRNLWKKPSRAMSKSVLQRRKRALPKPTTCPATGKKRWPDSESAVQMLHQAATARHFAQLESIHSRRSEVRHYFCSACAGWHVTSWEQFPIPLVETVPARASA